MIIKYTKESFDHKPNWETECKHLHWRQHQGGFFDYIYLWQTGHIMDIGDNELMDFIIVDIDNLPAGKREWLNTNCAAIANALDVRSCHVFDSSSRLPDKCKVYLELCSPVSTNDMETYLTEFEIYCDVEVDKCTKSAYQLNYGIMLDDPQYKMQWELFAMDVPSTRSTKNKKEAFLPINQQEKNRLLGKKPYSDPRLEWNYYRFIHRNGSWHRDIIMIKEGMRQKVLNLLVTIVTFNACMYNKLYNRSFTHCETYDKVCTVINLQYERAKQFLNENRQAIYRMCYNEWTNQMSRDTNELYIELCGKLNRPERYNYKPREYTAAYLYKTYKDRLIGLSIDEVLDRIGYLAEGEEDLIKNIFRYYKADMKQGRSDKGNKHVYSKRSNTIKYDTILNNCLHIDELYYIPKQQMSQGLRNYCSRRKIKLKTLTY